MYNHSCTSKVISMFRCVFSFEKPVASIKVSDYYGADGQVLTWADIAGLVAHMS